MPIRRLPALLLMLFIHPGAASAQASGQVSGIVNNSGNVLAHITVTLTNVQSGETQVQLTDAFGRYQFSSIPDGSYQVAFADQNFITFVDEDPLPDEGTIYLDAMLAQPITLQENQNLDLGFFSLARVDSSDNRQSNATVSDCTSFGEEQTPLTLAYALHNARDIAIDCAGTIAVPELTITQDVKITASTDVAFEAAGFNRIFRVLPGVTLQVNGIDLTNGDFTDGIALQNMGSTTIENAEITGHRGNSATIQNRGTLILRNTRQYRNSVLFDSVLTNTGVISGSDVTIESHVSTGGPVITNRGLMELRRCQISGLGTNNVWSVNNGQDSTLKLFDCTLTQSSSPFSNQGTLEIFDSSINNNPGDQGVIESSGVLKLGGTGVTNNNVSGAIIDNEGLAEIINSTISGNSAGFSGIDEDYAGVISNRGLMRVTTSTIANNTRPLLGDRQIGNSGELTLSNTIVSTVESGSDCGGVTPVQSLGYNLHTDGTCGNPQQTDISFGNPGLLALADNGGLSNTHALQAGSDAVDAGNCGNGATAKDQRGVARPQGNACDIGAYELIAAAAPEPDTINQPVDGEPTTGDESTQDGSQPNTDDNQSLTPDNQAAPNTDLPDTAETENPTSSDTENSDTVNNSTDESGSESDTSATISNVPAGGSGGGAVSNSLFFLLSFLLLPFTRSVFVFQIRTQLLTLVRSR